MLEKGTHFGGNIGAAPFFLFYAVPKCLKVVQDKEPGLRNSTNQECFGEVSLERFLFFPPSSDLIEGMLIVNFKTQDYR